MVNKINLMTVCFLRYIISIIIFIYAYCRNLLAVLKAVSLYETQILRYIHYLRIA